MERKNQIEIFLLVLILAIALFLRFYRINEIHFFGYDQARDALYIKRMIVDHKFRLIGTQSSIPGLYTGPAYYYLMAPFLWLFKFNPIGMNVTTALVNTLAVAMVYWLVRVFSQDKFSALLITLLYSIQPQIVDQSRLAWNPNTMPFFSLFFILGLFWVKEKHPFGWFFVFSSLAILLQLHYSAVCFLPVLILFFFVHKKQIKVDKWLVFSLLFFLVLMSPLLFFELRHNFINSKAILAYLKHGSYGELPPASFFYDLLEKLKFLLAEMVFGIKDQLFSLLIILILFSLSGLSYFNRKRTKEGLFLILSWILFGVFIASLYRGVFHNFYLTFLYPAGFLLTGILVSFLSRQSHFVRFGITLLFLIIFVFNLKKTNIFAEPRGKIDDLKLTAGVVAEDIQGDQPFNLAAALGKDRFDRNAVDYRYFLETFYGKKALDWDVLDYQNAEVLYLVSEVGEIDPLRTNIWEVDLFGPGKLLKTWKLANDVIIYKLRR